jgi:hypothetical protein
MCSFGGKVALEAWEPSHLECRPPFFSMGNLEGEI